MEISESEKKEIGRMQKLHGTKVGTFVTSSGQAYFVSSTGEIKPTVLRQETYEQLRKTTPSLPPAKQSPAVQAAKAILTTEKEIKRKEPGAKITRAEYTGKEVKVYYKKPEKKILTEAKKSFKLPGKKPIKTGLEIETRPPYEAAIFGVIPTGKYVIIKEPRKLTSFEKITATPLKHWEVRQRWLEKEIMPGVKIKKTEQEVITEAQVYESLASLGLGYGISKLQPIMTPTAKALERAISGLGAIAFGKSLGEAYITAGMKGVRKGKVPELAGLKGVAKVIERAAPGMIFGTLGYLAGMPGKPPVEIKVKTRAKAYVPEKMKVGEVGKIEAKVQAKIKGQDKVLVIGELEKKPGTFLKQAEIPGKEVKYQLKAEPTYKIIKEAPKYKKLFGLPKETKVVKVKEIPSKQLGAIWERPIAKKGEFGISEFVGGLKEKAGKLTTEVLVTGTAEEMAFAKANILTKFGLSVKQRLSDFFAKFVGKTSKKELTVGIERGKSLTYELARPEETSGIFFKPKSGIGQKAATFAKAITEKAMGLKATELGKAAVGKSGMASAAKAAVITAPIVSKPKIEHVITKEIVGLPVEQKITYKPKESPELVKKVRLEHPLFPAIEQPKPKPVPSPYFKTEPAILKREKEAYFSKVGTLKPKEELKGRVLKLKTKQQLAKEAKQKILSLQSLTAIKQGRKVVGFGLDSVVGEQLALKKKVVARQKLDLAKVVGFQPLTGKVAKRYPGPWLPEIAIAKGFGKSRKKQARRLYYYEKLHPGDIFKLIGIERKKKRRRKRKGLGLEEII